VVRGASLALALPFALVGVIESKIRHRPSVGPA